MRIVLTLLLLFCLVAFSSTAEQQWSEEPAEDRADEHLEEERVEEKADEHAEDQMDDQIGEPGDSDRTIVTTVTEVVSEPPVYEYHGVPLYYHLFRGYRVVDPAFSLSWSDTPRVQYVSDLGKYRVAFPIQLKYDFDLPPESGDIKWINFEPAEVDVHFFDGSREACGDLCNGLSVKVHKAPSGIYYLIFYCDSESLCSRTVHYFIDSDPSASRLFSFLEFIFTGTVDGSEYKLKKRPNPSGPVGPKPVKPACTPGSSSGSGDGLFRFESNRILLYAIKSKIGQSVYQTFLNRGHSTIPADRSLPSLYRSDAVDDLASIISRTGYTRMVAEMRSGGSMVAQVIFNVASTGGLNKENWFTPSRVVSSHPFWIGNSGFNFFSINGDPVWHRRFFINYHYPGCPNDDGFWVVLEGSDACPWGRAHWTGSAPLLIYNGKGRGVSYQNGGAVALADHFLIYLQGSGPDKLAAAASGDCPGGSGSEVPVGPAPPADDGFFRFEPNKVLLYTTKAKIGQSAYHTFLNRGNNAIPADRSLPHLYRSDAVDSLESAIRSTGYSRMVAEMRTGGSVVAQVVFDVSSTAGLNKENWFTPSRVVSSQPFSIGNSGFNFFSINGDPVWHRRFFINYHYPGCPNDDGFWVVLDGSDACPWGRAHWTGSAPLLIYNGKGRGVSYQNGGAATQADRFLIYLTSG